MCVSPVGHALALASTLPPATADPDTFDDGDEAAATAASGLSDAGAAAEATAALCGEAVVEEAATNSAPDFERITGSLDMCVMYDCS